ncbi:Hsp70 family protein [Asticcacaulis endophyticus]|uniref:Heat-shock protein n=1 Tax=Asticcacaulis endophyticus TaxID=1395890 RepID=A0A918Q0X3_9CAUL|nr:Hsp70 family protein [Asticcacaulis endophyticus]GGZ29985.1 heat-shock protein [Asticcacaulis endophyticus]
MTSRPYCGIDFGTSNSAVCAGFGDRLELVPVEGASVTLPSALFFNFETETLTFGRAAISEYLEHYEGRLMRALKSVLGSRLIGETTQIGASRKDFRAIIGLYIKHLKACAEAHTGEKIEDVVLGRPVHFVDEDPEADARAEAELRGIAEAQGFKNISFEYEPLAAARDYESRLTRDEVVLVVDIGGGTSDFSVIKLSPKAKRGDDRTNSILANSGVHIGGTDFDTRLSLNTAMREMGFRSQMKSGLDMPGLYYHQLATWHLINFLYTQKNIAGIRQLHFQAAQPELTQRLVDTVDKQLGHHVANRIEGAKIALSDQSATTVDLSAVDANWLMSIDRGTLKAATEREVGRIVDTAVACVTEKAGLEIDAIHTLFMTGGSTAMPGFEDAMSAAFPAAAINYGDRFSSVASGLGLAAKERYCL